MEVYEFEKTFLQRMDEARSVLCWNDSVISASQVRREWSCYVELQIEPTGWQSLWKIPRVICEDLCLRYPTVVFGYVDQVLFKELKAVFVVTAVQDDDVHIPERNEVELIDLWPTIDQENDTLNVECTADCLDRLRFFYTHIWMPWDNDNDDDRDWVEVHLESRIKLACDLNSGKVPRALASHIRTLLAESRYLQQRVQFLELDLSDNDDNDSTQNERSLVHVSNDVGTDSVNQSMSKVDVTDLMRLHLRLAIIRSEIEILENPEMRRAYNELKCDNNKSHMLLRNKTTGMLKNQTKVCYVVMKPFVLQRQLELLQLAKQHVQTDCLVQLYPTLQDVFGVCQSTDDILLVPGKHALKFLEYLNNNGSIKGLVDNRNIALNVEDPLNSDEHVIVTSSDDDSILLVVNGNFTIEQLVLDCRQVRTGILLKEGKLRLRNCRLIGDNRRSTQQAIVCDSDSHLILEKCIIESFATGISVQTGALVEFLNVDIKDCTSGIELLDTATQLNFKDNNCTLSNCKMGIYIDALSMPMNKEDAKTKTLKSFDDLSKYNAQNWTGNCSFEKCLRNIVALDKEKQLFSKDALKLVMENSQLAFDDKKF